MHRICSLLLTTTGHSRTIFTRFDPLVTGRVLPKEFKAAIASIGASISAALVSVFSRHSKPCVSLCAGLILSDAELQLFVAKVCQCRVDHIASQCLLLCFQYAVDDKGNIAYDDFIKYVHAKRDAQVSIPSSRGPA